MEMQSHVCPSGFNVSENGVVKKKTATCLGVFLFLRVVLVQKQQLAVPVARECGARLSLPRPPSRAAA